MNPCLRSPNLLHVACAALAFLSACTDSASGPPADEGFRFGLYAGINYGSPDTQSADLLEDFELTGQTIDQLGVTLLHAYRSYIDNAEQTSAEEANMKARLDWAAAQGYEFDYVLAYRWEDDAEGFAAFVRDIIERYGTHAGLRSLQVTNEANVPFNPGFSDGSFAGARDAVVQGIVAADQAKLDFDIDARRADARLRPLTIGFNWFYRIPGPSVEEGFWEHLRVQGGAPFMEALDWIGLDVYPGFHFPFNTDDSAADVIEAMQTLRMFAQSAGIPDEIPIHVQENGWPTATDDEGFAEDPLRTEEAQGDNIVAMIRAVHDNRDVYNVSEYYLFGLVDSESGTSDPDRQLGIVRDDYSPKLAFQAFADLVSELSGGD